MQRAAVFVYPLVVQVDLPAADAEVLPGVKWGAIEAFPSPAYWAYQVLANRVIGQPIRYRLGDSLREEVAACLLGGHGIPAAVGVAAFRRLKEREILKSDPSEDELFVQLSEPLEVRGRIVKYRFARQKAKYISGALRMFPEMHLSGATGRELRESLVRLPGVGYKTASWIARNWLDADDVAILDIHVARAGRLAGFLARDLTVERDYVALETQFLAFSRAVGVRASELDAVIWLEMASSTSTVRDLLRSSDGQMPGARSRGRANVSRADPNQSPLID